MLTKTKTKQHPLPSREDILAFIARERDINGRSPQKIGKREIVRAFNIRGGDRVALKEMLAELKQEGEIESYRKRLAKAGTLPNVTLADIIRRDRDGELIAAPVEWDEASFGKAPKILVHMPRKLKPDLPVPGIGDRALLRVEAVRDADKGEVPYTGRVVKILSRNKARVLGIFRAEPSGHGGRIVPIDKKQAGRELAVAEADLGGAKDGDLVSVDVIRPTRFGLPSARIRNIIGATASEKAVSLIAIHVHDIPTEFRAGAIAEAQAARPAPLQAEGFQREDWRDLPLVTIDPPDAKDHDDAVHAAPDKATDNPGGFIVTVAIADVSFYVRPHSALDRDALERGNSVYFPDRVVPMLPERISNDLCSLRAGEDRPAIAVRMRLTAQGRKIEHSFHRVMMRSVAKLSYQQAQAAFDGNPDETTRPLLKDVLLPLRAAYEAAARARDIRGPLDLDLPERKIILKQDGTVDRVATPPRFEAHRLIEEFMIAANVAAAETLEAKRQALIYRAHDEPSLEKMNALAEFLATIGIKFAKGQVLRPAQFNTILARVRETEHENVVNEIVLRTQAQAEYASENYGHFGLNLKRYAHFTSPIRRYADLIVHRALVRALDLGPGGLPDIKLNELAEIAARISAAERRAMAAERETVDRLIAGYLADRIGATFEARISGVTRSGLFVRLLETGADGFIPISTLGQEYFRFDEAHHAVIGNRSGEAHRLGDRVEVRLLEAAPVAGALRFELISEGRTLRHAGIRPGYAKGRGKKERRDIKPAGKKRQKPSHKR
ncbi:MAG: ribonuclease R [Methylobacteriaceae bacterium]|nr:ribonuclease R [Methylobacteriaceae bacterium]